MAHSLHEKKCLPCEGGVAKLSKKEAEKLLSQIHGWQMNDSSTGIFKIFSFKNFYQVMSFVNAIAWIANQENHHPNLDVGYNRCVVRFTTHAIHGLSENDFICASKIDHLTT